MPPEANGPPAPGWSKEKEGKEAGSDQVLYLCIFTWPSEKYYSGVHTGF